MGKPVVLTANDIRVYEYLRQSNGRKASEVKQELQIINPYRNLNKLIVLGLVKRSHYRPIFSVNRAQTIENVLHINHDMRFYSPTLEDPGEFSNHTAAMELLVDRPAWDKINQETNNAQFEIIVRGPVESLPVKLWHSTDQGKHLNRVRVDVNHVPQGKFNFLLVDRRKMYLIPRNPPHRYCVLRFTDPILINYILHQEGGLVLD